MSITVTDISTKFSVEKPVAYGFIKFLEAKGFIVADGTFREPGTRGKGSTKYAIAKNAHKDWANVLSQISDKSDK